MRKPPVFLGLLAAASMVLSACAPAQSNPYIGSGKLDGNGIPSDFFADAHIRKAFSYAFDWDTFVTDVYKGEAVQSVSLPLAGMPGFDLDAPHYTYDLEKSAAEFKLADLDHDGIAAGEDPEGDVWTTGFRVQMLYNQGNTTRQIVAEIIAASLSQVNELFVVEILGLPWPAYLTAQRAGQIPIMTAGFQEDIHDPHNWYQLYTTGSFGDSQYMPDNLRAQFKELLDRGVGESDPDKRHTIYQELNQLYYDLVPGVPIVLATTHGFEQTWVVGRVLNPLFAKEYYPVISKAEGAKNPDTFIRATISDIDTFDPALAYDTSSGEIIQNTYETLVFYDDEAANTFVPMLAESWDVSDDGSVYTFHIREGVKFHEGGNLTPSDVAYSFQRGLLQGGYVSPQLLLAEPFFGVGVDDISLVVGDGSAADDREAMAASDPAALVAACEKTKAAISVDDAAGTVTMTLAQPWGPFLPSIAQTWGAVMDKEWVIENGGWDGSCDTWQNFYAMQSADDPFTTIINGTGPYKLDHRTPGQEIVLVRNEDYWGTPAKLERVSIQIVKEWGTRFSMLQAGDADIVDVPVENRIQADALVGEFRVFDLNKNEYGPVKELCAYDPTKVGVEQFVACKAGETGKGGPLRLYIGRPSLYQEAILYNFAVK